MNIVYTCQENYVHFAGVSIASLLENNSNAKITIYFLDSGLSELSKERLRTLCTTHKKSEILFFDVTTFIKTYSSKMKAFQDNYATYAKLFIELLLPKDIDECLYIDADTLVLGSLDDCFKNRNDFTLYMAFDLVYTKHKISIGLPKESKYFNAGVIYINLKKWRLMNYSKTILNHLVLANKYLYGDQDIFNFLFTNDIGVLESKYNMITQYFFYKNYYAKKICFNISKKIFYSKNEINLRDPKILHFTFFPIILRPWFSNSNHPYFNEYYSYVKNCHFVDIFTYNKSNQKKIYIMVQKMINTKFISFFTLILVGLVLKCKYYRK